MEELIKFIGLYLQHEWSMSALCRGLGISRKTGYKLIRRYIREGFEKGRETIFALLVIIPTRCQSGLSKLLWQLGTNTQPGGRRSFELGYNVKIWTLPGRLPTPSLLAKTQKTQKVS